MIAVAHLVATLLMAGVIVYVQMVHYPLMARVGRADYAAYQAGHARRTGIVVIPLMLTELGTAVALALSPTVPDGRGPAYLGLGLLAAIWISTAAIQALAHGRLADGFDETVHRRLVRTNWIRTLAWLARVAVAVTLFSAGS